MHKSTNSIYRKCLTILASATFAVSAMAPAMADDTEIFFSQSSSNSVNNPNILLILDSSGSMSNSVTGDAQNRDRLKVVQDVAIDLISNLSNVNVGIMRYDYDHKVSSSSDSVSQGGMVTHAVKPVGTHLGSMISEINAIKHVGYTPLAETYYEAARYFMGLTPYYGAYSREGTYGWGGSWYSTSSPSHPDSRDGSYYKTPMVGSCQKNHIVYLSDGEPTRDTHGTTHIGNLISQTSSYPLHTKTTCVNGHGTTQGMCLDELADFLYQNDFSALPGKQNVTSHFIGFNISLDLFEDAAALGGGVYKTANNADDLKVVLEKIFNQVADTSDGFTAPAVTVNTFDRTSHLDQLYFTVFKPSDTVRWAGNLKKYRFEPANNDDGLAIIGQDNQVAVNPVTGFFFDGRNPVTGELDPSIPTAWSYWSTIPDGSEVKKGGAAQQLEYGIGGARILTNTAGFASNQNLAGQYLDDNTGFVSLLNTSSIPNAELTPDEWRLWAAGVDVTDVDDDGNTNEARAEIGAALHGKPAVVTYGGTQQNPQVALFFGTNDGVLHAINGSTGKEHFAFMPKELWGIVPELAENKTLTGKLPYGIDGHITVRKKDDDNDGAVTPGGDDFVHLYFGLRRGGNTFYSMDVTDLTSPKMKWAFQTSGQSWSKPVIARVNLGTDANPQPRNVVFVSGGYDPAQDSVTSYQDDSVGNSIHMLDADTGVEIWSAGGGVGHDLVVPDMKSSIPSEVRPLDMNRDGYIDRIYVNDIAGRLFRFDVHHDGPSNRVTAGKIASLGGDHKASTSNNRRFYYAPDIALGEEGGNQFLTITMASGFRASPLSGQHNDALFGVRDYAPFAKKGTDTNNVDADYEAYDINIDNMHNLISNSPMIPPGSKGWYRMLAGNSEKSLAGSRIFQNKAYFTTYAPGSAPSSSPCAPALGTGRLIVIDLVSGAETVTVLKKPGIPPEVTFLFGKLDTPPQITDTCFGSHCTPGPVDPDAGDDPDSDGGRPVQCLAGPEGCDADADERPERTYWRQQQGG